MIWVLRRWVAKLVAHLHATAAPWDRIQTSPKNTKWATKALMQMFGQQTLARQKHLKKGYLSLPFLLSLCRFFKMVCHLESFFVAVPVFDENYDLYCEGAAVLLQHNPAGHPGVVCDKPRLLLPPARWNNKNRHQASAVFYSSQLVLTY